MGKIIASINPFKQSDKTKNWFQNGTDTLTEVIGLFLILVLVAGTLFALFEGKDFLAGLWWAFVTGFTVGYGDIAPATAGGRVTGVVLMSLSTWVILPLIIVAFIKKHSPNRNEFTDYEQKEILRLLRETNKTIKETPIVTVASAGDVANIAPPQSTGNKRNKGNM